MRHDSTPAVNALAMNISPNVSHSSRLEQPPKGPRLADGLRTLAMEMVRYEDVGMERHFIALAIALQIGSAMRVLLENRGTAIPASEEMIEPARERRGVACGASVYA